MSRDLSLYGAIEAGGTKFVCALGHAVLDAPTQALSARYRAP